MLTEVPSVTPQLERAPGTSRPALKRPSRMSAALAFVGTLSLALLYALRGGAYDLSVFESYGLAIWWLIAVGVAVRVLPRSRPSRVTLLMLAALLAYVAWTGISLAWTESAERTSIELARSVDYVGVICLLAFSLDRDTWRPAAAGLGAGALAVCGLAVLSRLDPGAFPADYVSIALRTDRLSYPFGYWNAVGAWGAMSVAIGLAWSAHDAVRWRRALLLGLVPVAAATVYLAYSRTAAAGAAVGVILVISTSRNRVSALLHALLALVGSAAVIVAIRGEPQIARASGTRGALVVAGGLALAALVCAAGAWAAGAARTDRWSVPRARFRPIATAALVVALLAGGVLGPKQFSSGWSSFTHPVTSHSSDPAARLLNLSGSRYYVWKSAVTAFVRDPATGTGAGTFAFWWNRNAADLEYLHDTHNIWLQNMAELGAPGLLLILGAAGTALAVAVVVRMRARRRASAGAATALLAAFVVYLLAASVDWMWESTAVTVLALAGIAALGARISRPLGPLRRRVRGPMVMLALLAAALQVPGLLSAVELRRSQAAERGKNANLALSWANDAVDVEPWSASAYEQRGLVLEAAGRLNAAAADLRRAISHERTNFTHWLLLARIETERGRLTAATRDYRQAYALRPVAAVFTLAPYFSLR